MRNLQRVLAITLITSITMTSIATSRAYADIRLEDRSATVQVPVKRVETVMVPQQRVYTEVQTRQARATDIIRDDSENLTCRAYAGMDRQVLQDKYDQLKMRHVENFFKSPEGATGAGATVGATIGLIAKKTIGAVITSSLVGAALGWLGSKIYSWFKGKNAEERDLADRQRQAEYDQETLKLNCMENELKKAQIYAGTVPGQMPAGVSSSYESKIVASNSGSSSSSRYYEERERYRSGSSSGSADGSVNRVPSGCSNGGCGDSMTESRYNESYDSSSTNSYRQPEAQQVQVEERSTSSGNSVASCLY